MADLHDPGRGLDATMGFGGLDVTEDVRVKAMRTVERMLGDDPIESLEIMQMLGLVKA